MAMIAIILGGIQLSMINFRKGWSGKYVFFIIRLKNLLSLWKIFILMFLSTCSQNRVIH